MSNFYQLLNDVLLENEKTFSDLEDAKIIPERSYYQFKEYTPYLKTIINISNYLKVSLDYLAGRTIDNKFKKYNENKINFYEKLSYLMKKLKISQAKLSNELSIGRSNFSYWKNGTLPKFETLINLANYLNCSIDDLI